MYQIKIQGISDKKVNWIRGKNTGTEWDFNKELENMEKNQSKLKNTITEMKKALEEINSRLSDTYPLQYSCLENPMDGGAW